MKLKCKCGNKRADLFTTTAYITDRYCSDDAPGTVYIIIECYECGASCDIKDLTLFDRTIILDNEEGEVLDFSRAY